MKALYALIALLFLGFGSYAQEETEVIESIPESEITETDTMKMKFGKTQVLVISKSSGEEESSEDEEDVDTKEEEEPRERSRKSEAHWAGVDFGFSILLDDKQDNAFTDHPYWKNDAAKSQVWNLNIIEHKINFGTPFVGLTTGLGFNFTSVAFKNNYLIQSSTDSVFAVMDTVNIFSKNNHF